MKLLKKEIHGHIQCWFHGCRCADCVEAKSKENKKYYSKEKTRERVRKFRRNSLNSLEVTDSKGETNLTLPPGMR